MLAFAVVYSTSATLYTAQNPSFAKSSYLGVQEVDFSARLEAENITGLRFAAFYHPAAVRVGVLSGNEVVGGDRRFFSPAHYQDIYFFLVEEECDFKGDVARQYELDGILLDSARAAAPEILDNFSECFVERQIIEDSGFILFLWGTGE